MVEISSFLLLFFNVLLFLILISVDKIGLFLVQWVIFTVWFFLLPSYFQYTENIFPWPKYPLGREIAFVNFITLVFTFFLFIGYFFSYKNKISNHDDVASLNITFDIKTNLLTLVLSIPAILFIIIIGPMTFFMGRSTVGELVYTDSALSMLYALSKFSVFGMLLVYVAIWVNNRKVCGFGCFSYFTFFTLIIINLILNNPLSSPRFHFLSMAIALAVIFKRMRSRLAYISLFLISPFLLFIVFPLVKHLGEDTISSKSYSVSEYVVRGLDFDAFQQLVNIVRFVGDTGYSWGMNFISGISFFIPRSLWESKPSNLGMLSAEHQGYYYTNLSAPLVGEFYYSGDIIGVVLGGLIFGIFAGKADSLIRNVNVSLPYLFGIWLSSFSFIIFRGSFGSVAPMITLGMCSSLIILYIAKLKFKL